MTSTDQVRNAFVERLFASALGTMARWTCTSESYVRDDVTARVVASIHARKNSAGNTYRVPRRQDGRGAR